MKFQRIVFPLLVIVLAMTLGACSARATTQNFPGLVLHDERVYLSEGLHVYVVDVKSGLEIKLGDAPLRLPAESEGNLSLFAPVALTMDGQVIVPNSHPSEHSLFSIDPQTGNTRWTFKKSKGTWLAGALTLGDTIFAPGGDGLLYALDTNGNQRWTVSLSEHALLASPVSDGTLVFVPSMDGFVYALDPSNGKQNWQVELGNPIIMPPVLDQSGNLYIGTLGGELFAIQASSGEIIWRQQLEGSLWGAPATLGDTLYIGTLVGRQGIFYALQVDNGAIRWQRSEESSIIASPLAFEGQVVYVTETGRVQSLSTDGAPLWQADLKGKLLSAPKLAGKTILIAPLQGDYLLVAFDVNGAQRWTFKPEN